MIPSSVTNYLERNHARYSIIPHPVAYTAQEEAAAAHVPVAWAKSVVCVANEEPILAVVPAPCTVDLDRLQQTIEAGSIRVAIESELVRLYGDCEPERSRRSDHCSASGSWSMRRSQKIRRSCSTAVRIATRFAWRIESSSGPSHPTIAEFATGPSPSVPAPDHVHRPCVRRRDR